MIPTPVLKKMRDEQVVKSTAYTLLGLKLQDTIRGKSETKFREGILKFMAPYPHVPTDDEVKDELFRLAKEISRRGSKAAQSVRRLDSRIKEREDGDA